MHTAAISQLFFCNAAADFFVIFIFTNRKTFSGCQCNMVAIIGGNVVCVNQIRLMNPQK